MDAPEEIEALLLEALPRDLVMSVDEALRAAASRGTVLGEALQLGHRAHGIGQMRHFHMQEGFSDALAAGGARPTALRGNDLIFGTVGLFKVGRLNVSNYSWNNARRSQTRRKAATINKALQRLVHPDLFGEADQDSVNAGLAFFVAIFDRSVGDADAQALRIEIAVPDTELKIWLYRKPVASFLRLYEPAAALQVDGAIPVLKQGAKSGTEKQ